MNGKRLLEALAAVKGREAGHASVLSGSAALPDGFLPGRPSAFRAVVLILLDGFGWRFFEKVADDYPAFVGAHALPNTVYAWSLPLRKMSNSRVDGSFRFDANRLTVASNFPPVTAH